MIYDVMIKTIYDVMIYDDIWGYDIRWYMMLWLRWSMMFMFMIKMICDVYDYYDDDIWWCLWLMFDDIWRCSLILCRWYVMMFVILLMTCDVFMTNVGRVMILVNEV
jgi:hypothetical protein